MNTFARRLLASVVALLMGVPSPSFAQRLPTGGQVVGGQASISQPNPSSLHIQQATDKAIINWQGFSIGAAELVRFFQPGASAVALNRVAGGELSSILGQLVADGRIFLINPNGIVFGPGARVDVAGLLATTLNISDADFLAGRYVFQQGPGSLASVINQGTITAAPGGFVALSAPGVVNQGTITAHLGTVHLSSGRQLTVDFAGDGMVRFTVDGAIAGQPLGPDGQPLASRVTNEGRIQADGGQVTLTARAVGDVLANVVNNSGIIEARSLVNHGGVVRLEGGDPVANTGEIGWRANLGRVQNAQGAVMNTGTLDVSAAERGAAQGEVTLAGQLVGVSGTILARGADGAQGGRVLISSSEKTVLTSSALIDTSGVGHSSAGNVVVWSDEDTIFRGTILARGGELGGDGGFVEVSGAEHLNVAGFVDAGAPQGRLGTLLLDPRNITVAIGGTTGLTGVDQFSDTPGTNVTIAPATINAAVANVVMQANNDITVSDAIAMTNAGVGLTMQAGRDIAINANMTTNNGAISLTANDAGAIVANRSAGAGDITMASGTTLNAGNANITLTIGTLTGGGISAGDITARALTTTAGAITINSRNRLTVSGAINSGSGTITLLANTDGVGNQDFTQNAAITTTNAGADAVRISVNAAGGGSGGAALGSITTGSGGTLTVATDTGGNAAGGDITQAAGALLDVGAGTVSLATPSVGNNSVGTSPAPIRTTAGTILASAGSGGVFITETDGASFTATATGAGAIRLTSTTGTLTIAGATSTGSGAITLSSGDGVTLNAGLNAGSGTVAVSANTDGAGAQGFTQNAAITTTNAGADAVRISVNAAGGGSGGAALGSITTGSGGTLTVATDTGGNAAGGDITQAAGALLDVGTGTVSLATPAAGASGIGMAAAPIRTTAGTILASAGSGGVFITETDGASFTATAAGSGDVRLTSIAGTLTIAGATSTGSGAITVTSTGGSILAGSGASLVGASATLLAGGGTIGTPGAPVPVAVVGPVNVDATQTLDMVSINMSGSTGDNTLHFPASVPGLVLFNGRLLSGSTGFDLLNSALASAVQAVLVDTMRATFGTFAAPSEMAKP